MLSPRTLSLRTKSKALLKALDHCIDAANQNNPIDNELYGNSRLQEIEVPKTYGSRSAVSFRSYPGQDVNDISTYLWSDSEMSYPNSGAGQNKVLHDHIFSYDMNRCFNKDRDQLTKPSIACSVGDLKRKVWEAPAKIEIYNPEKSENSRLVITKNYMKRSLSESNVRHRSAKPIFEEQRRSADAQMHAPTHSHSISKCYCTQTRNTKTRPDSRYVVQLFGRKQRLPPRLKKQRYRSASLPRDSRNVTWADEYNHVAINSTKSKDIDQITESSRTLEAVEDVINPHKIHSPNHLPHCHHQLPTNLLGRVKTFRESHWSDCHALSGASTSVTNHECVQHYVLNDRLFLEPVHRDIRGEGSSSVCPHANFQSSNPPSNKTSHVLVTLPKVILESDGNCKQASHLDSTRRGSKQTSCFLIGHHIQAAKAKSFTYRTDSLALKYQKKA